MEYLLKVSAVVGIFYFSYKLFLQRDTFFESNRWFLLLGLISAFFVPFLVITEYIEYTPTLLTGYSFNDAVVNDNAGSFNLLNFIPTVYLLGVIFFSSRFILQITSLVSLIFKNKKHKSGTYTFVETTAQVSPFSFFNWIVYNPNQFNETELEQIITHEKIHVKQFHSIDVLLTQIACILLWFNPFIWFYNKDLKQNLEFLADHAAINYSGCKKTYQYTLLKTSLPMQQLALSNNFYNSLIKKRIVMLHKSKSKKINQIKFALVIPLLALFLMAFNTKKVYVEKATPNIVDTNESITNHENSESSTPIVFTSKIGASKNETIAKELIEVIVTKESTDADLDNIVAKMKKNGVTIKFKGVKRNSQNEIRAIKIDAKSKNSNANFALNSDEGIKPIKISFNKKDDSISIGNGKASYKKLVYHYSDDEDHDSDHKEIHKIRASKNGNNVFFISDDDEVHEKHGDSIHFRDSGDKKKYLMIKKNKEVNIDSDDDGVYEVEVMVENDEHAEDEDIFIIKKDGDDKESADKKFKIKSMGKDKGSKKIFITTDDGEEPIYIINGKEVDKKEFDALNADDIERVNVFKGDAATKKHGNKAKDGVVEITTKKKK